MLVKARRAVTMQTAEVYPYKVKARVVVELDVDRVGAKQHAHHFVYYYCTRRANKPTKRESYTETFRMP